MDDNRPPSIVHRPSSNNFMETPFQLTTRPLALAALREIAQALSAAWDLDTTLDLIARKTTEVMGVNSCTIYLLDPDGETLRLRATTGLARRALGRATLKVGEGMTGYAVQSNQPVYAAEAQQDSHFKWLAAAEERLFHSLLAIPLVVNERPIGALNVQTFAPHNYSREEIGALSLIGDLAAGALVKAQLYDQQTSQLAELRALADENARLVTNAAVVREMHHRIKNNLQTVAMLMQLQLGEAGPLDARQVLSTGIHRVRTIAAVHEVLSEQGFRLVDVKDVLERISRMTMELALSPARRVTIDVEGEALLLPARAATAVALVVNELAQNALDHAFVDRPEGHLLISLGRAPDEFVILVRDDGVGLPDAPIQGVGLEIVETLVRDDLQGRLKFSRLPAGTEVTLRIPRAVE